MQESVSFESPSSSGRESKKDTKKSVSFESLSIGQGKKKKVSKGGSSSSSDEGRPKKKKKDEVIRAHETIVET